MTGWTNPEKEVVDNSWEVIEAWEEYRALFGFTRSFESIKRRWYRSHPLNGKEVI